MGQKVVDFLGGLLGVRRGPNEQSEQSKGSPGATDANLTDREKTGVDGAK